MRRLEPATLPLLLTALLLSFLQLAGCAGPSYYAQAFSGHLNLMHKREDIAVILDSEDLDPELALELRLATEIREFAISELGLPDNDSYRQFVSTGKKAVIWNVVAAPEFSLQPRQWCFLVSGCVPYRGYYKHEAAKKFANKLARKGYDVFVSGGVAYSTLGWFDDPLLDTMFQYSDEQLAAFIFHELAHQQLYVKGDAAFNEAYASFIEGVGVQLWLESTGRGLRLDGWLQLQEAARQFNILLDRTREKLELEYASASSEATMRANKSAIFQAFVTDYLRLVDDEWDGRSYYAGWFSGELNNARLALAQTYQGGVCVFENLYRSVDGDLARFQELAAVKAALNPAPRRAWLNEPCEVVASKTDL